jgi:hypothetical protein
MLTARSTYTILILITRTFTWILWFWLFAEILSSEMFTFKGRLKTLLEMFISDHRPLPGIRDVTDLTLPGRKYFWGFRISWNLPLPNPGLGKFLLRQK